MTARMYYDDDADPAALAGQTVAIIGYGSQGHAHALNLHESGVDVVVGLAPGSKSRALAAEAGLRVLDVADAVRAADVVMILVPDTVQKRLYDEEIAPNLRAGHLLMFAHGFNIRYGRIDPSGDRRRRDGRAEGPRPPAPLGLQGGRRRAGPVRGRARRVGDGPRPRPRLRPGDRLDPRRHPRDDVRGGDRDRPVRRAGGPVRRHGDAGQDGLRDAGRGRLPARAGLLRDAPRAQAHRRPAVPRRAQLHALLGQRHGRVRRLRVRPADSSTTTSGRRCRRSSRTSRTARSRTG